MSQPKLDQAAVEKALDDFQDPESGRAITKSGQVRDIQLGNGQLSLTLQLTTHSAILWNETKDALAGMLQARFPELESIDIQLAIHHRAPEKLGAIGLTAKSVIAVGSGKGGVGKSTIAASIALGLKRAGSKVGLMDADVYGPSIPHLLGVSARPEELVTDSGIVPVDADGLSVMSLGFLVKPQDAVIWRGPMLHHTVTQFLRDVKWGELDYLIIDMPPGTGDVALSLSQLLPLTGAIVVCTPQEVALLDAVKAIAMFHKVNIPVLGMVENMSGFVCPDCNKQYDIFGKGGARQKAQEMSVPFLGEVPIHLSIRQEGDRGNAEAVFDDQATAGYFDQICHQIVKNLAIASREEPPLPSLSIL